MYESTFLQGLIGTLVSIVGRDQPARQIPPVVLREISGLGIVGEDRHGPHFFPWNEVAEISPCAAELNMDDLVLAMCVDSEP